VVLETSLWVRQLGVCRRGRVGWFLTMLKMDVPDESKTPTFADHVTTPIQAPRQSKTRNIWQTER
jgi:hypothetical protein